MKKIVKISDKLKSEIEVYIALKVRNNYYAEKEFLVYKELVKTNQEENKRNIIWQLDKNGKVVNAYWQEGLSKEENKELETSFQATMQELLKNFKE